MKKPEADVSESIRSGEYFRHSRTWYAQLYHAPIVERSYLFIIMLIALVTTLFGIKGLLGLLPISPQTPFYLQTEDIIATPTLKPIADSTDDPNIAVLGFMLGHYVSAREEYDLATYKQNQQFVVKQSSPEVTATYAESISLNNPNSPAVRYQDRQERHIRQTSMRLNRPPGTESGNAVIQFSSELTNGAQPTTEEWIANIAFRFSDITIDQKTGDITPMTFAITGYDVKQKEAVNE